MHSILKQFSLTGGLATVLSFSQFSYAHEMRHVGGANNTGDGANVFMFHVGFLTEPAFATEMNGIDINLSFHPDEAHDKTLTETVDTAKGDTVIITTAEALYFERVDRKIRQMKRRKLAIETDDNGNIKKKYGTENKYPIYFRPTRAGTYGFRLKGSMAHAGVVTDFDETFICENGSQDIDINTGKIKSKFSCVKKAIDFPNAEETSQIAPAQNDHNKHHNHAH